MLSFSKKHLLPNGKVVIQIFNPNPIFFQNWENLNVLDYEFHSTKLQTKVKRFIVGEKHDANNQIISYHYKFKTKEDEFKDQMNLGYLYHEQALKLFNQNQFEVINSYSNWDENEIQKDIKEELIYILKFSSLVGILANQYSLKK